MIEPFATRADALRALVQEWPVADGAVVTAADLVEFARTNAPWHRALVAWCPPRGARELPTARSLGCMLGRVRGIPLGGFMIDVAMRGAEGAAWTRRTVSALSAA